MLEKNLCFGARHAFEMAPLLTNCVTLSQSLKLRASVYGEKNPVYFVGLL